MSDPNVAQLIPPVNNNQKPASLPVKSSEQLQSSTQAENPWSSLFPNTPAIGTIESVGAVVALVFFAIVFWFVRTGVRQHLIERKASFSRADTTAWLLWITLMVAAVAVVVGFVSKSVLLVPIVYGPLAVIGALCLLFTIILYNRSVRR